MTSAAVPPPAPRRPCGSRRRQRRLRAGLVVAPVWTSKPRADSFPAGLVGARAARLSFAMAGLAPSDVDVAELYDPFSFEIIRQLEAFGFCGPGEGGPFVEDGNIGPEGAVPVTTDGGTMSFSHPGIDGSSCSGSSAPSSSCGGPVPPTRSTVRMSPCARTAARAPCSATSYVLGRERP